MKVVILAGGLGTRLSEETVVRPKPMVEIGGKPILWHIMSLYSAHGFNEFVVAMGYKGEVIRDYFLNYHALTNDLTIDLATGHARVHGRPVAAWTVHLVDTGEKTQTAGRVGRLREWLDGETFMLTYGDGVSDVDLGELLAFHQSHGKLATVTAVRPPARFGGLVLDGPRVESFTEKPQSGEGWINGGFFVLDPQILDLIRHDEEVLEIDCMEALAKDGELMAYRHDGFWQPMDTVRDRAYLEDLWRKGNAPWKVWENTAVVEAGLCAA